MKRVLLVAAALGTLSIAAPAAAQGWQPIEARLNNLDRRIDQGVRNGALTDREARNLRAEFRLVANLEARYRANGLSQWERNDLDRRFDDLSRQIRTERADNQRDRRGQWGDRNVNARQAQLDRGIDRAIQRRQLTAVEAQGLRNEFRQIAFLEARYRQSGGLDRRERADLDRRFDGLEWRLRTELADNRFRWGGPRYF